MKSVVLALGSLLLLTCQPDALHSDAAAAVNGTHVMTAAAALVALPHGRWEATSKGAIVLGDARIDAARIEFAHAGAAAVVPREGYVSIEWETPARAEIPQCVGGALPMTAQLAVQEVAGRRVLEIAFFRGTGKPVADRDTDAGLCQIQYWTRLCENAHGVGSLRRERSRSVRVASLP
jgi:hypothetical protein